MALDMKRNWQVVPEEEPVHLMGVAEVARDEAEDNASYQNKGVYDPWRGEPHGEYYRAIDEALAAILVAEVEERMRTFGDKQLHCRTAIVAGQRLRSLADRYDALAAALKTDLENQSEER